ncbi:hypothetical protein D6825_03590 [Candidatus Woesearchaeota archaeon]|nr:MAG: hypothetical protein D6825_03590 [Candidatus Woesearchaeota archaeon]
MRKAIFIIALVASIFSLALIALVRPQISPRFLELRGVVISERQVDKVTFIEFVPDNLTVVSFNGKIGKGRKRLYGRLKQYKGKVEFVVEGQFRQARR